MASPHPITKPTVNLASSPASSPASTGPRPSRIRRDPPPVVAQKQLALDPEEREQRAVVIGIIAFALAIFVIIVAAGSYAGWSPRQYTVNIVDE